MEIQCAKSCWIFRAGNFLISVHLSIYGYIDEWIFKKEVELQLNSNYEGDKYSFIASLLDAFQVNQSLNWNISNVNFIASGIKNIQKSRKRTPQLNHCSKTQKSWKNMGKRWTGANVSMWVPLYKVYLHFTFGHHSQQSISSKITSHLIKEIIFSMARSKSYRQQESCSVNYSSYVLSITMMWV